MPPFGRADTARLLRPKQRVSTPWVAAAPELLLGQYIAEQVVGHAVLPVIHEEPFTRRAYQKPRGYAGDAPLLDLVYGDAFAEEERFTEFGQRLHDWAVRQPACRSVQVRRDILANLIDDVAASRAEPRMLSVACGHLREAQLSEAVRARAVAEFVALDQDAASIAVVEREQRHLNVTPVRASIRRLLAAPGAYGTFDLAYAAGLYDYLPESVAQSLTSAMFDALRPGGLLLVANFAPELRDIAYMEAIMGWTLIYRDEDEVRGFAGRIDASAIAEQEVFRDEPGNVVYLKLRKA